VRFLYPPDLQVREESGLAPYQPDKRIPYLAFTTAKPARQQYFLCAIVPEQPGQPPPQLEYLQGDKMMGVQIRHPDRVTDVYLNLSDDGANPHRNSNTELNGWETDASLLALTRRGSADAGASDSLTRYLVINGSYLRRAGRTVLDSLSKLDALVVPAETKMQAWVQGQRQSDISVGSARHPASLELNGRTVPSEYDNKQKVVRFTVDAPTE
jgi:hypothetical protein